MTQTVIVVPTTDVTRKSETFQFHWTIPNWKEVCKDEDLVNNQKIILEADPSSRFQTKWTIGLKAVPYSSFSYLSLMSEKTARVYWQLIEVQGAQRKFMASIRLQLLKPHTGVPLFTNTIAQHVELEEIVEMSSYLLVKPYPWSADSSMIHSNGSVRYALLLSLESFESYQMDRFTRKSNQQMCKNLEALLTDDSSGDLKIKTRDGATISAHKNILKSTHETLKCPIFAAMFNSETLESCTGLVNVDDVSEKTMKILLHYFYTSELLPTWRDEDTVVEFTYSAGKYQMTYVLELLDDLLGSEADAEVTYRDVQLLNVAGKLSLKNAEMRLLQQIKDKMMRVKASDELFKLFGLEQCKSEEDWGKLGNLLEGNGDKLEESMDLKIVDYALGNLEYEQLFNNRGLQALASVQKYCLKNVERILLKRFAVTASKVQNADELFAIFGDGRK